MTHALVLEPKKEIHFSGPYNEAHFTKLLVQNQSDKRLAFKLLTIEPRHYVVRPSKGIIEPGASVAVDIKLHPIKNVALFKAARQKFMVQSVPAPVGTDVNELFTKALVGDIATSKIRAIFDDLGKPADVHTSDRSESSKGSNKSLKSLASKDSKEEKEKQENENPVQPEKTIRSLEEDSVIEQKTPAAAAVNGESATVENELGSGAVAPEVAQCSKCPMSQVVRSSAKYVAIAAGVALVAFIVYRYTR